MWCNVLTLVLLPWGVLVTLLLAVGWLVGWLVVVCVAGLVQVSGPWTVRRGELRDQWDASQAATESTASSAGVTASPACDDADASVSSAVVDHAPLFSALVASRWEDAGDVSASATPRPHEQPAVCVTSTASPQPDVCAAPGNCSLDDRVAAVADGEGVVGGGCGGGNAEGFRIVEGSELLQRNGADGFFALAGAGGRLITSLLLPVSSHGSLRL